MTDEWKKIIEKLKERPELYLDVLMRVNVFRFIQNNTHDQDDLEMLRRQLIEEIEKVLKRS